MNFKEIQELIRMISKSDLASFKVKNGDFELNIKTGKAVQHVEMKVPNYGHPLPPPPIQAPVVQKNQSFEEPQAAVVSVDTVFFSPHENNRNKENKRLKDFNCIIYFVFLSVKAAKIRIIFI